MSAQDVAPYDTIPAYYPEYSSGAIIARMIDGLGYRYHWATHGLRDVDLNYKPTVEASSSLETIEHIYGLSVMIKNAVIKEVNVRPRVEESMDFNTLRQKTLKNLQLASQTVLSFTPEDIAASDILFQRAGKTSAMPFWHILNGPLADALYHTGQIVSFRRTSGNPLDPSVNVFMGRNRP